MNKLLIIHFLPLEVYPPVMNLLNYLAERKDMTAKVVVCAMKDDSMQDRFVPVSSSIRTVRRGTVYKRHSAFYNLLRYAGYAWFYVSTLLQLIRFKPQVILYFDTLSFLPAFLYRRYFSNKVVLMAHYHEYMSPAEYKEGMRLNREFHVLEKKEYPFYRWLSHTNEDRMRKFLEDNEGILIPHPRILPNYPPMSWRRLHQAATKSGEPLKILYVGALSIDKTMYTRNFADWVVSQGAAVVWHIYSTNISAETIAYIKSLQTANIEFKGGVPYKELPDIISQYDVGIILYTGHIPNYVYNAPNKLFEYVACGLDVWFPRIMKGSLPYQTQGTYPRIIALDFDRLSEVSLASLVNKSGLTHHPSTYFSEIALAPLADDILNAFGNAGKTTSH